MTPPESDSLADAEAYLRDAHRTDADPMAASRAWAKARGLCRACCTRPATVAKLCLRCAEIITHPPTKPPPRHTRRPSEPGECARRCRRPARAGFRTCEPCAKRDAAAKRRQRAAKATAGPAESVTMPEWRALHTSRC